MKLKLVKASVKYKSQIMDMLDELYSSGEKIIPSALTRSDYHNFENYYSNL